jgi:tetratricopeptide (TPR) repeat protein
MRFENQTPRPPSERRVSKGTGRFSWRALVLITAGLILLISALAALYVRERQRTSRGGSRISSSEITALKEISQKKEDAFEEIKLSKADLTETDTELLDEAVKSLERYTELASSDNEQVARLAVLRRQQHIVHAERLRAAARKSEARADQEGEQVSGLAVSELKKAQEAEKEIEKKWYDSGLGNPGKITQLDVRIRRLEAEPIWKKTRELAAQAEGFFKEQKLSEAEDCFKESIRLEREFTEKYRDVLNTEFNRLDKLNARLETVRSYPQQQALEKIEKEAQGFEAIKDWAKAAVQWQEAMSQIGKIIVQYPLSQYASRTHEIELVKHRNLARYRPEIDAALNDLGSLRQMLRTKQIDAAADKARALLERMNKLETISPGLFPESNPAVQEVDYITKHEGTMRVLLPLLDRLLLPVPGTPKQQLLKHEVAQSFYSLVHGKNPSALVRGTAPVESVSYEDADVFCREVSWLTGRTVRLPTLAEIKLAAGDLTQPPARQQAWSFDSTDGLTVMDTATSQPNYFGFYDIIGNVEEWVEAEANTSVATVVGGNVNWVPAAGLPQRQAQKKERSRTLGFRFIVE